MGRIQISLARTALVLTATCGLLACSVQSGPGGKVNFALDDAELFGRDVGKFNLADGDEGTLRVLNGRYTVKLRKQLKVIPLENATVVKVIRADQIGDRTLVILEKAERNCNYKTQILSIRGSEVLMWDFGECNTQSAISVNADSATFDFVQPRKTLRFTYRDMRLLRAEFPTLASAPVANAAPDGSRKTPSLLDPSAPRYQPGPPQPSNSPVPSAPRANAPTPATPVVAERKSTPAPAPRPPVLPKAMEFPAQEQKPVRIVLDK